ncbi:molybdate ABC transporter substrate-binding protein [Fundidesulfovibrio agrisoli]|uniref:molybdate ABC transporter substrate-binding protein n=1 Tax=Fundidesulfovibrio agrisoli TaxID=2922717 RepID=UPI001FABFF61|nr:molybdate ABC transporter substrate-binding protein [Fundidesulfovibrio agrisoli]
MRPRFIAASLLILAVCASGAAHAGPVTIGAGAGYKRLLVELNTAFSAKTGIKIEESYGHLGQITAQAKEGGRFDVIFGDLAFFQTVPGLGELKHAAVGKGRLVVAWAKGAPVKAPSDIAKPAVDRVAIPDAKSAIYGKAGMEFLERSGMLAAVKPKLIEVATVPQVTAYLMSGEVQAGLVNVTDAMGAGDKIGGYAPVDQALYDPILIVGAVMPEAAAKGDVARYLEFLATPEARAIAEKHGL